MKVYQLKNKAHQPEPPTVFCLSPAGSVTVGCGGAILNPPLTSCVMGASLPSWLNVNDSAYPPGVLSSLVTMYTKRPAAQSRSARHPTLQSQTHPTQKSLGFRAPGFEPHQSEVSRGVGWGVGRTELQSHASCCWLTLPTSRYWSFITL